MDTIIDVARREKTEANEVILYPEGIFYRAYGCSALRFIRNIRPYQVKKRYYKKLGAEICYLGFPQAAFEGMLPPGFRSDRRTAEGTVVISGPFDALDRQEYEAWVRSVPLSVAQPRTPANGNSPVADGTAVPPPARDTPPESDADALSATEREVLRRLQSFALETATPLQCMNFLSELRKRLNG